MGGSDLVQTHLESLRSLDHHASDLMSPELEAAVPNFMTQLIIVLVPITTTLRLVPVPIRNMGMDTTMDPSSEDERTAQVHIYQIPLGSAHGKKLRYSNIGEGTGSIDDATCNQSSNVNVTSLLYT